MHHPGMPLHHQPSFTTCTRTHTGPCLGACWARSSLRMTTAAMQRLCWQARCSFAPNPGSVTDSCVFGNQHQLAPMHRAVWCTRMLLGQSLLCLQQLGRAHQRSVGSTAHTAHTHPHYLSVIEQPAGLRCSSCCNCRLHITPPCLSCRLVGLRQLLRLAGCLVRAAAAS